jgi:hypothetical protein
MLFWFVTSLVMAFVVATIAGRKGRSAFGWFVAAAIVWPIALIAILCVGKTAAVERRDALESGEMRTCPHCAETIRAAAIVCRYCGNQVDRTPGTAMAGSRPS